MSYTHLLYNYILTRISLYLHLYVYVVVTRPKEGSRTKSTQNVHFNLNYILHHPAHAIIMTSQVIITTYTILVQLTYTLHTVLLLLHILIHMQIIL